MHTLCCAVLMLGCRVEDVGGQDVETNTRRGYTTCRKQKRGDYRFAECLYIFSRKLAASARSLSNAGGRHATPAAPAASARSRCSTSAALGRPSGWLDRHSTMRACTAWEHSAGTCGMRHEPRRCTSCPVVSSTSSTPRLQNKMDLGCGVGVGGVGVGGVGWVGVGGWVGGVGGWGGVYFFCMRDGRSARVQEKAAK